MKTENAANELLLRIPSMDCVGEEQQIRRALVGLDGVRRLRFDLPARRLAVTAPGEAWPRIVSAIESLGFTTERLTGTADPRDDERRRRRELARLAAALAIALLAEGMAFLGLETIIWRIAEMAVAGLAITLAGGSVFVKGLASLRRGRLDINALMTVAVTGAFLIGEWPEAAMVMALYSLAEVIESRAVERARNAIRELLDLTPAMAEVRQPDGNWVSRPVISVVPGSVVRVRPGERAALDGRVLSGQSAIDQSPVTGESIPVDKGPGDPVYAGSINQNDALEVEVTSASDGTVLARIIHAVEEAQASRAPTQRFVDRFAAIYTPAVFLLSLGVAVGGPLVAGWSWTEALYKALVLLVIACPCALVISTPVTIVSGLAAAARRGVLIKGGAHLETARKLRIVAMDKTGTVTEGKPALVATEILSPTLPGARVLRIARSLASRSDHPVSQAIARGLDAELTEVDAFGAEAGRGVHGSMNGHRFILGNHRWIEERGQCSSAIEARLSLHEGEGRTTALLADESGVLAVFAVADTIRDNAREAVYRLRALGIDTVMLTGDNSATAQAIAHQAGIRDIRPNLLPQDKHEAVRALADRGPVAMVGDGINDAPALAAATAGFAMGRAGTDIAVEAASMVVMNDDLRRVPETIALSRRTHAVLWQNIALALGIKFTFLLMAVFDDASMWMAVFADMGASLMVVLNGLRLLKVPSQPA